MKILLIHCHYRLPGGEDAVFAAERALLERRGHTVLVYERSNEEAAHGLACQSAAAAARSLEPPRCPRGLRPHPAGGGRGRAYPQHAPAAQPRRGPRRQALRRAGRADAAQFPAVLSQRHPCCGTAPSARIAPAAACTAHCSTAATAAVWRRPLWSPRPTGCTGRWAAGAVSGSRPRPKFDREKLLAFNRLRPTFDENRLVVKPNPVNVPAGPVIPWEERDRRFRLCRPAGGAQRGCAPSSRRGVCWATPRPSCSSPGTARWPTGRAHRRCPGSGFSASLSVRSCTV